jgi:short-subunit dehydrogenase
LEIFSVSLSFELAAQHIKVKQTEPGMADTNFDNSTAKRKYLLLVGFVSLNF